MNIRQLECLHAVIRFGTMTKAAQELGISQPAISNLIASLEHEFGFVLFERSGSRLHPTAEAQYLLSDVERTIGSFERTRRTAKEIRNRDFGRLVIASYPGLSMRFLPRVVTEFLAGRSSIQVELHSRSSEVLHEILLTQRFDIAIAGLPVIHPGVRFEPMTLLCKCIMPTGHRLASKAIIRPTDLSDVPIVSVFRELSISKKLASIAADAGAHWNVVAETRFFESACAFVAHGVGVAIVDAITASEHDDRGVVVRPFEPRVTFDIGLVYPPERPVGPLLKSFLDLLKARMRPFLTDPS